MNYLGTVGARRSFTLYLRRMWRKESEFGFRYYYVCTCEGEDVVYHGSVYLGEIGETVTLTATVKEHQRFKGRWPTTIIWHPKLEKTE